MAALLLAVLAVFCQTGWHDFVNYDDNLYVTENSAVNHGLTAAGLAWVFTHSHGGNWHPLTGISHMLDCQIFGLWPGGHHLSNVLLHGGAAVASFLLLYRVLGCPWRRLRGGRRFCRTPLRAESVAWVAERKDVLSGLFFMLTLAAYVEYARRPFALARYFSVVALFSLGLMAKPMLVTLPLVLLLLDYWPLRRVIGGQPPPALLSSPWSRNMDLLRRGSVSRVVLEKLPLMVLSVATGVATLWAQRQFAPTTEGYPLAARIGNAMVSYAIYVRQMAWPVDLGPFYPHPGERPVSGARNSHRWAC